MLHSESSSLKLSSGGQKANSILPLLPEDVDNYLSEVPALLEEVKAGKVRLRDVLRTLASGFGELNRRLEGGQ